MNPRLLKTLKYAAAYLLLPSAFFITSVQPARSEELYLFLSPEITVPVAAASPRSIQQKKLKIDEKGDLLIQYGGTRFTVAYNEPEDQFKPTEQQKYPQRDRSAAINGISLTASLYF
jgi:hypothetical protein